MPRAWVWVQLLVGWLPVWALYSALIITQHHPASPAHAAALALRAVVPAALLGLLVPRFARRVPWPRPFRLAFAAMHLAAAALYAVGWMLVTSAVESVGAGSLVVVGGPGFVAFLILGVWLYVMVAGISYAIEATERAAHAEAAAARMQLAALRAQLHPHFLFNALHAVVQLIPLEPARAADAAEQVASLLRTAVEEDRDLVSLRDEWAFVSRYLDLERMRFGDRLRVRTEIDDALLDVRVPSFALQTLVENAVRHAAAPRVQPTDITVVATGTPAEVTLRVRDTGDGAPTLRSEDGAGTGLARLRDRLAALYGGASRLTVAGAPAGGVEATLVIPRAEDDA